MRSAEQQAIIDALRRRASGSSMMPTAPGGPVSTPNAAMGGAQWVGAAGRIGAPGTMGSGFYQREIGGGDPNMQQLSPQAMAMLDEMRRRAALPAGAKMAEDRGVFAGGQQAQPMPVRQPPQLPGLYGG